MSPRSPTSLEERAHTGRFALLAGGGFVALAAAMFTPLASLEWRGWITPALTAVLVVTLLRGRSEEESNAARRFWRDLTLAATSALAVLLSLRLLATGANSLLTTLVTDALFMGYYLGFAVAVERKPERRRPPFNPSTDRWTWPASATFVVGAFVYFVVLPALFEPELYVTGRSTQTLFAALDAYLVLRLVHRAIGAQGRWRRVYALLTVTTLATLSHALLRLTETADGPLGSFLWYLPISAFLLAARERHRGPATPRPSDPSYWPRSGDQAMMLALAAPIIHFSLCQFGGASNEDLKPVRELLALLWTIALGGIAFMQRRAMERKALHMLAERERLNEELGGTHDDLRMIVESRSAAQALSVSESKLERALEVCPDAIAISTVRNGRFVEINPAFEALTGHRKTDILGRTSSELGLWLQPEHRASIVRTVRQHGYARDIELPVKVRSGGRRTVLFSAQPLDIDGEAHLIIVGRDVTNLRAVEAATAVRARLLHAVHEAVYAINNEGHIAFWNRGAERLYRWSADEAREHDAASLLYPYAPGPLTMARSATQESGQWQGRLRPCTRTGTTLQVISRWTRLSEPNVSPAWMLVIDTDHQVLESNASPQ